jgi:hypothetical protein
VIEHHQPGAPAKRALQRAEQGGFVRNRQGEAGLDEPCAGAPADLVERQSHRVVGLGRGQDLVAAPQLEGAQDGVHPRRCVLHENDILGPGVHKTRKRSGCRAQRPGPRLAQKAVGVRLHAMAPARGRGEHGSRRGAERAVIQEGRAGLEKKAPADGAAESGHAAV